MKIKKENRKIEITVGRMSFVINGENGGIVYIEDKKEKIVHLNSIKEGKNSGQNQKAKIKQYSKGIQIIYNELQTPFEKLPVSAVVNIKVEEEEIFFTLKIENRSSAPITEVMFPMIGGWSGIDGKEKDKMIIGGGIEFDPHSLPKKPVHFTYMRIHQRAFFTYPTGLYLPWIDISSLGGGISYINYTEKPRNGGVFVENLAGYKPGTQIAFGWTHWPLIKRDKQWTSPTIGISVHSGRWYKTADKYNKWTSKWFSSPPTLKNTRSCIGFQNVFLRSFDGSPIRHLNTIPEIARDGRKYGVNHLCIWDFMTLGNYTKHADFDLLDYTVEEREILKKGIHQARKEGTDVSALINFRLVNSVSTLYKTQAYKEVIRNFDGSLRQENYPGSLYHAESKPYHFGPVSYVLSTRSKSFRERVLRQTRKYLSLGYNSMFFDQPFETFPDYGHMNYKNSSPDDVYEQTVKLLSEVRKILHRNNPNSIMIGEYGEIFASQFIDVWMFWYGNYARKRYQLFERVLYSLPQSIHSWVVDSDIYEANKGFSVGGWLCLTTHGCEETLEAEPVFAQHILKLANLRKKCAERISYGKFKHKIGLETKSDNENILTFGYDSKKGPAVIVAAGEKGGKTKVNINPDFFNVKNEKEESTIFYLNGSEKKIKKTNKLEFRLKPYDVIVWFY